MDEKQNQKRQQTKKRKPTLGSLFAGIGGFDLGFERAGFVTSWQVEIEEIKRAVLADGFPHAERFADVRAVGAETLSAVDCLVGGFPCQDISNSGSRKKGGKQGLAGERSGLFSEVVRLLKELQPRWVVLENVAALLHSNDCRDIETVIRSLAECGYVGCFRVLDGQFFGSPCRRRRIYLVGGLGEVPPDSIVFDASAVEPIPSSFGAQSESWCPADVWAGPTLQATNAASRITLGNELLIAEADRWHSMGERQRMSERDGLLLGVDAANLTERHGAGNAVDPRVAQWIAQKLIATF